MPSSPLFSVEFNLRCPVALLRIPLRLRKKADSFLEKEIVDQGIRKKPIPFHSSFSAKALASILNWSRRGLLPTKRVFEFLSLVQIRDFNQDAFSPSMETVRHVRPFSPLLPVARSYADFYFTISTWFPTCDPFRREIVEEASVPEATLDVMSRLTSSCGLVGMLLNPLTSTASGSALPIF